jgi:hypothetical protein
MLGVFISHNHEDKTFVRRFGADLAAAGVRPWREPLVLARLSWRQINKSIVGSASPGGVY